VNGEGPPERDSGPRHIPAGVVVAVSILVMVVAVAGLAVQAVRGNRTVSAQGGARVVRNARVDDAFYHCLDVQTRSLVSAGQPVTLTPTNLGDLVTMLKGVGSWVTIADPPSRAVADLSLRNDVHGGGACLGTVVVAHYPHRGGGATVRIGSGASVPGSGPPPAPPL
jgi:hypothetical protein